MCIQSLSRVEKVRQQKKTVIWFIWFVSFVWLNQKYQMNQINKTSQIEHPAGYLDAVADRVLVCVSGALK